MKVKTMTAAVALALLAGPLGSQSIASAAAPSRPFGSHPVPYVAGSVLPSTQVSSRRSDRRLLRPVEGEVRDAGLRPRRIRRQHAG